MSSLLIKESPVLVLPSLAKAIGINESIVLQQINYWINPEISNKYINGRWWTYNTYEEWKERLCWLSKTTIGRTFRNLEKLGLVISENFNNRGLDRTKWYTIDYERLKKIEQKILKADEKQTLDRLKRLSEDNINGHIESR